ncbi:outer membrane beta-barrel protein [Maribacter sp. MMG018]|uniref:outer membrane beta-barrel protein n=1 Tax=Maribacter sp. MMG018 TaxID=2822688 RepID=UPI001B39C7B5|nr:outer membrane beta-barrel protein [Maribacter sp. MMG018]MBQ4913468.1 outer membrane beta-barrel protein [Maribacter sp. MMG018]
MSKKKIDQLFQEKFLDFKKTPDQKVWSSIEASLDKKKKKRILPLWWQLGGIAATLVLGLLVFNPFQNEEVTDKNPITDIEKKETQPFNTNIKSDVDPIEETEVIVNKENTDNNQNQLVESTDYSETTKENSSQNTIHKNTNGTSVQPGITVLSSQEKSNRNTETNTNGQNDLVKTTTGISESAVAQAEERQENIQPTEKELSAVKANGAMQTNVQSAVANNDPQKEPVTDDSKKRSIFEAVTEQEEDQIAQKSEKRWSAGPSVAPVYYNAIGDGSPLSPMFASNSKSGDINLSYGVAVAYEINSKLSVRSGIHKVDYGYNTNDVYFTSSLSALENSQIPNIDYAKTSDNLIVSNNNTTISTTSKTLDVSAQNAQLSGEMGQKIGYLEVPVELSYALINNKLGVNVIGGVSSLFLVDNEVSLTSGALTTEVGEANNINDVNFSANVGIGLDYKFTRNVRLNIEPVFKYQLNTFSNVDGSFNPYSLGIYSGLSFKF